MVIAGEVTAGAAVERRVERPRWFRVTVAACFLVVAAIAASGGADSLAGPAAQSGIVLVHLPGDAAAAAEGPNGARSEIERAVRAFQPRAILPEQVEPNPGLRWGATGMIALGTLAILISTVGWVMIVRRTSPLAHPPVRGGNANGRWE